MTCWRSKGTNHTDSHQIKHNQPTPLSFEMQLKLYSEMLLHPINIVHSKSNINMKNFGLVMNSHLVFSYLQLVVIYTALALEFTDM